MEGGEPREVVEVKAKKLYVISRLPSIHAAAKLYVCSKATGQRNDKFGKFCCAGGLLNYHLNRIEQLFPLKVTVTSCVSGTALITWHTSSAGLYPRAAPPKSQNAALDTLSSPLLAFVCYQRSKVSTCPLLL